MEQNNPGVCPERVNVLGSSPMLSSSSEQGELFAAIAKARPEFKPLGKSKKSNHGAYSTIVDYVAATELALSKNGLHLLCQKTFIDNNHALAATLTHSSGQWTRSIDIFFPADEKPQTVSGCQTYAMKNAYRAILGIVDDSDDNDGAVSEQAYARNNAKNQTQQTKTVSPDKNVIADKNGYVPGIDPFRS